MPKRSVTKKPLSRSARLKSHFFQPKLSFFLLLLGVLCITVFSIWRVRQAEILSFNQSSYQSAPVVKTQMRELPTQVQILSQGIDLPIVESLVVNNQWQINPSGASHLVGSANPGEGGNIVIYGHNLERIFGKIRSLKVGETIVLSTKSGHQFRYVVKETSEVTPKQVEIIAPTSFEVLTLYTCTGLFDSKRFVVKALPA